MAPSSKTLVFLVVGILISGLVITIVSFSNDIRKELKPSSSSHQHKDIRPSSTNEVNNYNNHHSSPSSSSVSSPVHHQNDQENRQSSTIPVSSWVKIASSSSNNNAKSKPKIIDEKPKVANNYFKPNHGKHIGTVAICFFGLVKNVKPQHAEAYRRHLYQQLWANGYSTVTLMHTYRLDEYSNKRSGETAGKNGSPTLNQNGSIDLLRSTFTVKPWDGIEGHKRYDKYIDPEDEQMKIEFSQVSEAEDYFHTFGDFLKHGDPWPEAKNQTLKFYLRQQYSLLRLSKLLEKEQGGRPEGKKLLGAVFIRPDLLMYDNIDMSLFGHVIDKQTRIALPTWFLYWNSGFVDRFAYGSVPAMITYGSRGEGLREYAQKKKAHAEGYLHDYLCEIHPEFEVHLTRTRLARVRLHGVHGPDGPGGLLWLTNSNENRWKSRKQKNVKCPFKVWQSFGMPIN